jgi:hypothetical protein
VIGEFTLLRLYIDQFGGLSPIMSWPQDIVISILFPYLLPSLPVCKNEIWSKQNVRAVLGHLLVSFCNVAETQELLKTFTGRMLCSSNSKRDLEQDLHFLVDIESRCSFTKLYDGPSGMNPSCKLSVHSLFACSFLIQYKIDIHQDNDIALRCASEYGYKDTVSLLIEHKAYVHAKDDCALRWASGCGHTEVVALLIEHKADVHAKHDDSLRWAKLNGHKDVVNLLFEQEKTDHLLGIKKG